jgi:hypothetical protein
MLPVHRSKTNRRTRVQDAKRHLGTYGRQLGSETAEVNDATQTRHASRVTSLLWAEAMIQRALALETRGKMGDFTATPKSLTNEYARTNG